MVGSFIPRQSLARELDLRRPADVSSVLCLDNAEIGHCIYRHSDVNEKSTQGHHRLTGKQICVACGGVGDSLSEAKMEGAALSDWIEIP